MEYIFLNELNSKYTSKAEKLILSAFKYFSQNYKKNIIFVNNFDNQEEEKIQQLKINDSDEIVCKSPVGLYPLEGKGRIYFDCFVINRSSHSITSYRENFDENMLFEYIVKSLKYLDLSLIHI